MDRLQNAKKSLAESLNALESEVMRLQNSADRSRTAVANSPTGGATAFDLDHLSHEVMAIEADLERAIQMITELAAEHPSGDSI